MFLLSNGKLVTVYVMEQVKKSVSQIKQVFVGNWNVIEHGRTMDES